MAGWLMAVAMAAGSLASGGAEMGSFRVALDTAAGQPVRLDPRIGIPDCAGGHRFERRATAVDVRCPATGWRLVVPVASDGSGGTGTGERLVRRGNAVVVESVGAGYAVRVDGVAETDAAAGDMVRVRNARSGQRMLARVAPDGRLVMDTR